MNHSLVGKVLKIGLLVWMGVVIWAAIRYAPPAQGFRVPELARIIFFHVPCSMVALRRLFRLCPLCACLSENPQPRGMTSVPALWQPSPSFSGY